MNHDKPTAGSPVKVVKVTYNSDSISAPRLMVQPHPDIPGGDITCDMTVEDVLDKISHKVDESNIQDMGCHHFERLCTMAARDPRVWANHAAITMVGGMPTRF